MAGNNARKQVSANASAGKYFYYMNVSWNETSTSIANNTSVISISGSMDGDRIGFDGSPYTYYLKLYWHDNKSNGDKLVATSAGFSTMGYGQGGSRSVSGSTTVEHHGDGSLSGYAWMRFESPSISGGYAPPTTDVATANTALTTIARASSIGTISGSTIGGNVTVNINRNSNSFTHTLWYKYNGSWRKVATGVGTSHTFTLPMDVCNLFPNSTGGNIEFMIRTFNGTSSVGGDAYKTSWVNVPNSVVPSIGNPTASRVDNGVPSNWGVYVQGYSKVTVAIPGASGSYGSTIKSYSISGPGIQSTGSSATSSVLRNSGDNIYTCTVTDSRGRRTTKKVTVHVESYEKPSVTVTANRCNSDGSLNSSGSSVKIIVDWSIASVAGKNTVSSKSVKCNNVTNTTFLDKTSFVLATNCSIGTSYPLVATVKDALGSTVTTTIDIPTAHRILNIRKNKKGLAIGKFSEKDSFEVAMPSEFYNDVKLSGSTFSMTLAIQKIIGKMMNPVGSVVINTTGTNPGTYLGGTWEPFAQGRTLIGAGTGNDGSTSMSFTSLSTGGAYRHTLTTDEMPKHDHDLAIYHADKTSTKYNDAIQVQWSNKYVWYAGSVQYKGMGNPHDIVQPYIACHLWHRIA